MEHEMKEISFELNKQGLIIIRPVLGWTTAPIAAETTVILRLQYAETPAEVQTGGRALQVALTAPQAIELSQVLAKQAENALRDRPTGPTH
jgi:hypothetical protein